MQRIGVGWIRPVTGRVFVALAIALLLSSCLKLDMALTVTSDNTVNGTAILGINKQILQMTGQTTDQIFGKDAVVPSGTPGVTTTPYEDDVFAGEKVTFKDVPLARINQSSSQDSLKIVRDGDVFRVSGAMDLSNGAGDSSGSDAQLGQFVQQAMKTADIKISITFPGPVTSSNGTIDGNTVTWTPKIGERTELTAVAAATGSSLPLVWILIGVGAVAILAAGAVVVARRRKGDAVAQTPGDPSEVAAPGGSSDAPGVDTQTAPSADAPAGPPPPNTV